MGGIHSFGTILQVGDGGTPTEIFVDIAEIVDNPGLNPSVSLIEDTVHNQASRYMHNTPGLFNAGKLALKVNYNPTEVTHGEVAGLDKIFRDGVERNYRWVFNVAAGSGYYEFPAVIESCPLNSPINGLYTKTYNFQLNDEPIWYD